jgi:hypothetical protein
MRRNDRAGWRRSAAGPVRRAAITVFETPDDIAQSAKNR